jgi:hypothetical protein
MFHVKHTFLMGVFHDGGNVSARRTEIWREVYLVEDKLVNTSGALPFLDDFHI